jgi:mannose-6-phosphate isomerase-like protein (cupin superfamily)
MTNYSVVNVDELAGEGPDGRILKVRRALDARGFGLNLFRLPAEAEGLEHDHADAGQEEVYFVLAGSGVLRVEGEEVERGRGTAVRVAPEATRRLVAGPEGLEYLAIGAPIDSAYEPPNWG